MELKILNNSAHDLRSAVYQAVGAASMCWQDPGGAGVFQEDRATQISEELLSLIRQFREED